MNKTAKKIVEAAKIIFFKKGMTGARMQEIADEAKINKALLFYYFDSKEKLFDVVFKETFTQFFTNLISQFNEDNKFEKIIEDFIKTYTGFVSKNFTLIKFSINESQNHFHKIESILREIDISKAFLGFKNSVKKAIEKNIIRKIDPKHLLLNIISMCIFPFFAQNIVSVVFKGEDLPKFYAQREKNIIEFVKNSIFI